MKRLKVLYSLFVLFFVFSFVNVYAMEKNLKENKKEARLEVVLKPQSKRIIFDFTNRKKKEKGDLGYADSTEIAENVLKANKNIYKRMINKIYRKKEDKPNTSIFYAKKHFDLDYVGVLLDEYLNTLRNSTYNSGWPVNTINFLVRYYEAFKSRNSKLFLIFEGFENIDKTGLFSNMVGFELSDKVVDDGFFNFANTPEAILVFNQILEFFVVFIDFYRVVDGVVDEHQNFADELPKWARPKVKEEGEYALLYPGCFEEFKRQDSRIKKIIKEDIIKNMKDKDEKFNYVKFNGESEDLKKFYEIVYNEILERKWIGSNSVCNDEYFKLFNPKMLKYINILKNISDAILLKFNEDCKFDDLQLELLKSFRSFKKSEIDYLNSMPGVAVVKQIILLYVEAVKEKKK